MFVCNQSELIVVVSDNITMNELNQPVVNNIIYAEEGLSVYDIAIPEGFYAGDYYNESTGFYKKEIPVVPPEEPQTEEEKLAFTVAMENKLEELSALCGLSITNGIVYNGKKFSLKVEDQPLLNANAMVANMGGNVLWHPNGESCTQFTPDKYLEFYSIASAHILSTQTYHGYLRDDIRKLKTMTDLNLAYWGQPLSESSQKMFDDDMAFVNPQA